MIHFEPMPPEDFADYWKYSVESWARDMKRAKLIDENMTFEEAEAHVRQFIPEGMKTPGHFFMYLCDGDERVGRIWLEVRKRGVVEAYLWDIVIEEEFRGKGYGGKAMILLEEYARERGAVKISLNVFASNDIARRLYRNSGYREAAISMIKEL